MKQQRDEPGGSPVRLTRLLTESGIQVEEVRGDPDVTEVTAVDFDSRAVRRGSLFCCVPGATTDGHVYAAQAVQSGAAALLVEHLVDLPTERSDPGSAGGSPDPGSADLLGTAPAGSRVRRRWPRCGWRRARCGRPWPAWPPPSSAIPPVTW